MASFTERVQVMIDVEASKLGAAMGKMKTDVSEAEGAFGKLKAGASGVFDVIGASPIAAGAAVAAGLGTAAKVVGDLIGDFQDLALTAGDTATKMGTSVEDASRWMEVSDDLGVSIDAVATAAGRLNKEADQGKLAQYGIDAEDSNGRLLQTLDLLKGIPDEAERARVGTELLGKGWQNLAPLVDQAGELRDRLGEVSNAKVVSETELARARAFRDAMDNMVDTLDDVKISLGEAAVPFVQFGTTAIEPFIGAIDRGANAFADLTDKVFGAGEGVQKAGDSFLSAIPGIGMAYNAAKLLSGQWEDAGDAGDQLAAASAAISKQAVMTAAAHKAVGDVIEQEGRSYLVLSSGVKDVTDLTAEQVTQLGAAAAASAANTTVADEATDAAEDQTKALQDQAKALQDQAKALTESTDAMRGAADAQLDLTQKTDDYGEFLGGLDKALQDAGGDQAKLNDVYRDAIDKAAGVADAVNKVADEQAAANGTTQSATGRLDAWNASMLNSAGSLRGPVRGAVLDYIATVNGIPPEKMTEINAAIDAGDIATAQRILNETSAARTADINADANTAEAEKDINYTARDRNTKIHVSSVLPGSDLLNKILGSASVSASTAAAPAPAAGGDLVALGARSAPGLPTAATAAGAAAYSSPAIGSVVINMPPGTQPTAVVNSLRKWTNTVGTTALGATGL